MIAAVVAVDENWGIGSNNKLLASIPEDMKNFKKLTTNSIIIMGRKTYDSLPIKPLPNRVNVVITSNPCTTEVNYFTHFVSMDLAKIFLQTLSSDDIFIIGGGTIYNELLPYCEKIYATKIHNAFDNVDTYFPNIDCMSEWELMMSSNIRKHDDIRYQFCIYKNNNVKRVG